MTPAQKPTTITPQPSRAAFLPQRDDNRIDVCSSVGLKVITDAIEQGIKEQMESDLLFYIVRFEEVQAKECPLLRKTTPDLYDQYQKIIAKAKWYLFPRLGPSHVENLFANHMEFYFAEEWDRIVRGLRVILIAQGDGATRDAVKGRWRNAIARSKVRIGTEPITVAGLENQPATVGNWLRDFRESIGINPVSPLGIVEYLNTNPHIGEDSNGIRPKVEHLLKLYYELTKSSQTPEGAEEQVLFSEPVTGTYHIWEDGGTRDTGIPLPPDRLQEMRKLLGLGESGRQLSYAQLIRRTIAEEQKNLNQEEVPQPFTAPPPVPQPQPKMMPQQRPQPLPPATPPLLQEKKTTRAAHQNQVLKPTYGRAQASIAQRKKIEQMQHAVSAEPEVRKPEIEDILASTNPIFENALRPQRPRVLPNGNGRLGNFGPMRKAKVITDIVPPASAMRALSPIEELQRLDVTEFRRLAPDPRLASQKVIEKFQLLEEDSISKKADGIDAYYASPLHSLYVAIGNSSLEQSRPVADVMQERKERGEETLRQEEFDAIADLNRQIRY